MRENTDQNNSEYGHFLLSEELFGWLFREPELNTQWDQQKENQERVLTFLGFNIMFSRDFL